MILATIFSSAASSNYCDRTFTYQLERATQKSCDQILVADLVEIKTMGCVNCGIGSLKANDFQGLPNLEYIGLAHNGIGELPEGIFFGLSSLKGLSIYSTGLKGLSANVFKDLHELKTLYLGGSVWGGAPITLPENVFSQLKNLEELELYRRELTELPEKLFFGLSSLKKLDLSQNRLSSLPDGLLEDLKNLENLQLRSNNFSPEEKEKILQALPNVVVSF